MGRMGVEGGCGQAGRKGGAWSERETLPHATRALASQQAAGGARASHLWDVQALLPDAGGHQNVDRSRPELQQHLLLLALLHAAAARGAGTRAGAGGAAAERGGGGRGGGGPLRALAAAASRALADERPAGRDRRGGQGAGVKQAACGPERRAGRTPSWLRREKQRLAKPPAAATTANSHSTRIVSLIAPAPGAYEGLVRGELALYVRHQLPLVAKHDRARHVVPCGAARRQRGMIWPLGSGAACV